MGESDDEKGLVGRSEGSASSGWNARTRTKAEGVKKTDTVVTVACDVAGYRYFTVVLVLAVSMREKVGRELERVRRGGRGCVGIGK